MLLSQPTNQSFTNRFIESRIIWIGSTAGSYGTEMKSIEPLCSYRFTVNYRVTTSFRICFKEATCFYKPIILLNDMWLPLVHECLNASTCISDELEMLLSYGIKLIGEK